MLVLIQLFNLNGNAQYNSLSSVSRLFLILLFPNISSPTIDSVYRVVQLEDLILLKL